MPGVRCQCTIPSFLADTSWWDSDKGLLHFGQTNVTGWTLYYGQTSLNRSDWECFYNDVTASGGHLILRLV